MDSSLLNVFHDDPFDGNYAASITYGTELSYWSNDSDSMDLQLTETLDGILPITTTDEASVIYGNSSLLKDPDEGFINTTITKNAFNFSTFTDSQINAATCVNDNIQNLPLNPNAGDVDNDTVDDDDDGENHTTTMMKSQFIDDYVDLVGEGSQCSYMTFRTRTNSSSIADYESHSSDYEAVVFQRNLATSTFTDNNILPTDDFILDEAFKLTTIPTPNVGVSIPRTLSTNTIGSDIDGLGYQIDGNTFDLADFITKDDFALNLTKSTQATMNQTDSDLMMLPSHEFIDPLLKETPPSSVVQTVSSSSNLVDSDSDDDLIIDVETVEFDDEVTDFIGNEHNNNKVVDEVFNAEDADVGFVDNVKTDPSWSPKQIEKKKTETVTKEAKTNAQPSSSSTSKRRTTTKAKKEKSRGKRGICLVPNKKQCDLLKRKINGKTINATAAVITTNTAKLPATAKKSMDVTATSRTKFGKVVKPAVSVETPKLQESLNIGRGRGGKNLALLKHELVSITETSSDDNTTPIKEPPQSPKATRPVACRPVIQPQQSQGQQQSQQQPQSQQQQQKQNIKRKLNLEEYKKRRGDGSNSSSSIGPINPKQPKLDNVLQVPYISSCSSSSSSSSSSKIIITKSSSSLSILPGGNHIKQSAAAVIPKPPTTPTKHTEAITAIVKTLKSPQGNQKQPTDPITEARNKVLRMQQLKRAQQLKILDSTVSAKVPRVTKLPPLKEIVKGGTYCQEADSKTTSSSSPAAGRLQHPDYEELIIVSASCNTDLSIPPKPYNEHNNKGINKNSRSLLKSSVLLNNFSDSFHRVQQATSDKPKMLHNSLIASIQHEVVKKAFPTVAPAEGETATKAIDEHHGEDKIIMYLPKNRDRKCTASIGIQTELQPEFPMLTLLLKKPIATPRKSRERIRHKHRSYRKHNTSGGGGGSRSCSAASSASSCDDGVASVQSQLSNASECLSNTSNERLRSSDATAAGGYSSRSTRRHRSSVSSSYSDDESYERSRRQRRTSYKRRSRNYERSNSSSSSCSETEYNNKMASSRVRSRSPLYRRSRSRSRSRNGYGNSNRRNFTDRNVSQPAVEERRIVYVGRIEQETTKDMLRRKFLRYGTIKQITIHYKETGMKYGFVTFERAQDAFTAIDTSAKDDEINMYDISFGGRRAFCRASYADLDSAGINNYQSHVYTQAAPPKPKEDDSFEALLLKVKAKLHANKPPTASSGESQPAAASAPAATQPQPLTSNTTQVSSSNKEIVGKI